MNHNLWAESGFWSDRKGVDTRQPLHCHVNASAIFIVALLLELYYYYRDCGTCWWRDQRKTYQSMQYGKIKLQPFHYKLNYSYHHQLSLLWIYTTLYCTLQRNVNLQIIITLTYDFIMKCWQFPFSDTSICGLTSPLTELSILVGQDNARQGQRLQWWPTPERHFIEFPTPLQIHLHSTINTQRSELHTHTTTEGHATSEARIAQQIPITLPVMSVSQSPTHSLMNQPPPPVNFELTLWQTFILIIN